MASIRNRGMEEISAGANLSFFCLSFSLPSTQSPPPNLRGGSERGKETGHVGVAEGRV